MGNQVVHEAEEEGMKLLLLVEVVEEKRQVEQEEKIMFRTIHHLDDAEIHLGNEGEVVKKEIVEIPEEVRDPLAADKELLSLEDKVDLRVE